MISFIKRKWKGLRRKICRYLYRKNDRKYLAHLYRINFGSRPDIDNPKTFNEKLLWLKLYWRDDRCYPLVDKYEVREYVTKNGLEDILVPCYGVYETIEEFEEATIPFPYVLKVTHDSGGVWFINGPEDLQKYKNDIVFHLNRKVYNRNREWPYYKVRGRLIAEAKIETKSGKAPIDYKFFCFNGKTNYLFVATDRPDDIKFDFFDVNWNHIDVRNGHPNSTQLIEKPEKFDEMIKIAEKLSSDFPHVRVDLYNENGKIYFGEMTFFHFGGNTPFEPKEFDYVLGKELKLPNKMEEIK